MKLFPFLTLLILVSACNKKSVPAPPATPCAEKSDPYWDFDKKSYNEDYGDGDNAPAAEDQQQE